DSDCQPYGKIFSPCQGDPDCQKTCQEPVPKGCARFCQAGCICPHGKILNTVTNKCVSKCPI
uniref:TIL domain-containing protein n=1 Tax=Romanomermis culicivorax TaxID=13658 RepID=A0A915ILX0_ROMCU